MFSNVLFLYLHTPDAWWTVKEAGAVGDDISGVCIWFFPKCLVKSEVSLPDISSTLQSWMASNSAKTENLLSFHVSCKSSLSCFDWLFCFSVSGKIRNYYWLLIKNAWHSLFYVAREISRQFYQICAHFLLHEWPWSLLTLMEIDHFWICIYSTALFQPHHHLSAFLWDPVLS